MSARIEVSAVAVSAAPDPSRRPPLATAAWGASAEGADVFRAGVGASDSALAMATPRFFFGRAASASARPAAPAIFPPAPVALPGPRSRTDGAGGPQRFEARPGSVARAARGRSTSVAFRPNTPGATNPGRGAVTRKGAALAASPQGLTATAAHTPLLSAGVDPVHPADAPAAVAVSAPSLTAVLGTTTLATSLTHIGASLLTGHQPPISAHTLQATALTTTTSQAGWVQSANHRKD